MAKWSGEGKETGAGLTERLSGRRTIAFALAASILLVAYAKLDSLSSAPPVEAVIPSTTYAVASLTGGLGNDLKFHSSNFTFRTPIRDHDWYHYQNDLTFAWQGTGGGLGLEPRIREPLHFRNLGKGVFPVVTVKNLSDSSVYLSAPFSEISISPISSESPILGVLMTKVLFRFEGPAINSTVPPSSGYKAALATDDSRPGLAIFAMSPDVGTGAFDLAATGFVSGARQTYGLSDVQLVVDGRAYPISWPIELQVPGVVSAQVRIFNLGRADLLFTSEASLSMVNVSARFDPWNGTLTSAGEAQVSGKDLAISAPRAEIVVQDVSLVQTTNGGLLGTSVDLTAQFHEASGTLDGRPIATIRTLQEVVPEGGKLASKIGGAVALASGSYLGFGALASTLGRLRERAKAKSQQRRQPGQGPPETGGSKEMKR